MNPSWSIKAIIIDHRLYDVDDDDDVKDIDLNPFYWGLFF